MMTNVDRYGAWRRLAFALLVALAPCARTARADDGDKKQSSIIEQIKSLQKQARSIDDNWGIEAMRLKEAHEIMFQRNGWTSESDQFALNLINQVSTYGPFDAQARQNAFIQGVQGRFGLTESQVDLLNNEMRKESMDFTMKHFDKLMPVALEAVRAKAAGKPFTPEMVAKWSRQLEPIMGDALQSVERVTNKLEATMDDSQKALLEKDMAAVVKRHNSIKKQMKKWERGEWTPYDFGLEHNPEYQAVLHKYPVPQSVAGTPDAPDREELLFEATRKDQTLWAKYVADFVNRYHCDDKQRNAANAILKDSESEAAKYIAAHGDDLEYNERRAKESPSKRKREYHAKKAEQLRKPIERTFDRMCRRLESSVLNREQRRELAADKAKQKSSSSSHKRPSRKTASRNP